MINNFKDFLKNLSKKELKEVINLANEKLNSTIGIGDTITLTIDYMIGDSDGDTEEECTIEIKSQDDIDGLDIIRDILDNHTEPNQGTWGFIMDSENFSKKPKEVYNLLYKQKKAPKTYTLKHDGVEYKEITINSNILKFIGIIKDECFRGETEYSFLVYQDYSIKQ